MKKTDKDLFINSFKKEASITQLKKNKNIFSFNKKINLLSLKKLSYNIGIIIFTIFSLLGFTSLLLLGSFLNIYSDDNIKRISEITSSVNELGIEQDSYNNLYFIENIYNNKNMILIIIISFIVICSFIAIILEFIRRKNAK